MKASRADRDGMVGRDSIGSIEAKASSGILKSPGSSNTILPVVIAGAADASALIDVISEAFFTDPTWSWAFPDPAARRGWWTQCISEALRYPSSFASGGFETVSVWIPPSASEFSAEGEQRVPSLLHELVGPRADSVGELLHRFEQNHPRHEPHYYLSLLGTRNAHRGRGLGMALLAENLRRIDAEHRPAYLESSNPDNNARYQSVGFDPVVSFQAPGDGPVVTGMWRDKR